MRVSPELVYLEIEPCALILDLKTGDSRTAPCVRLHWKPDPDAKGHGAWRDASFTAVEEQTIGELLCHVAQAIDENGLDDLLTRVQEAQDRRKKDRRRKRVAV